MTDDAWSRQLDGRLIYQHLAIFEPELRCRHLQRLARIARRLVVSDALLQELARSGPRERALAFVIEHLHTSGGGRAILKCVVDAYRRATESGPLVLALGGPSLNPNEVHIALAELQRRHFDHFVTLAVGALLVPRDSSIAVEALVEGQLFGAITVSKLPNSPADLLLLAARALMTQWWQLESEALDLAYPVVMRGHEFVRRFGQDVVSRFTDHTGAPDTMTGSLSLPDTPFCRDLTLAWAPSGDRVGHTIGSVVNHYTSLDDLKRLEALDA